MKPAIKLTNGIAIQSSRLCHLKYFIKPIIRHGNNASKASKIDGNTKANPLIMFTRKAGRAEINEIIEYTIVIVGTSFVLL
jgi:hypothetical protein